jgi:hypothetical protein
LTTKLYGTYNQFFQNKQNHDFIQVGSCRRKFSSQITENNTVIRFVCVSAKFGTCTVVSIYGTLVEDKMCTFTLESTHFIFNKCPIYTHDGASAKFSTNSYETDNSVLVEHGTKPVIREISDKGGIVHKYGTRGSQIRIQISILSKKAKNSFPNST